MGEIFTKMHTNVVLKVAMKNHKFYKCGGLMRADETTFGHLIYVLIVNMFNQSLNIYYFFQLSFIRM